MVRRLFAVVGWLMAAATLAVVWPSSLGGCTSLTTVSGHSMEPTLSPGDLTILWCGTPQVGDIVGYRPFPDRMALVIHRIIGGDEQGWRLQGDNNTFVDPFYPDSEAVKGVMVARIPGVGTAIGMFASPLAWGSAFLLAAAVLLWPRRYRAEPAIDAGQPVAGVEETSTPVPDLEPVP